MGVIQNNTCILYFTICGNVYTLGPFGADFVEYLKAKSDGCAQLVITTLSFCTAIAGFDFALFRPLHFLN